MGNKFLSQCKVGDYLAIGKSAYEITNETKTQFICKEYGKDGSSKYHFDRVMKSNGKVVGGSGWASTIDNLTKWLLRQQTEQEAKAQIARAREQEQQERYSAVKNANPDIQIIDRGNGLSECKMVNQNGQEILLFFTVKKTTIWRTREPGIIPGVNVSAEVWHPDYHTSYNFGGTQADGVDLKDALITMVSNHFWRS